MKTLRIFLPLYLKTLEKLSKGHGYGRNKNVRKILRTIEKSTLHMEYMANLTLLL